MVGGMVTPGHNGARVYVGHWDASGRRVVVESADGVRALPHPDRSSRVGFVWGRPGPGALDLAYAILEDTTGSPTLAERLARDLSWGVISRLPADTFRLSEHDVRAWLEGGRA